MRGRIRKRGTTSWQIRIETGRDPNGVRNFDYVTIKGSRKDAETELTKRVNEVNTGAYVEGCRITVAEFFDRWITTYAEGNVSAKTLQGYRSVIESHVKPAFGSLPLQKLTPFQIQSHYAKLLRNGGRKDGRPGALSPQTVLHQHRLLSEAFRMAVRWQLLARNPCDAVTPPKMQPREVQVIDENETAWLIDASQGTRLYLPILMSVCAGLRRGEILAATWGNLDTERGTLRVVRALSQTKNDGVFFKEPKSRRSRTVALPPLLLEALAAHRAQQEENREMLGSGYADNDLICCLPDGSVWKPSAFTSTYGALLRRRGLSGPNFHALRHSHASHMLRAGVDLKAVQMRLGHARASFTLGTYAHLLPGQDEEAARRIDALLRKAIDQNRQSRVM